LRPFPRIGEPEQVVEVVFGCRPEDVAEDVVLSPFLPLKSFQRHLEREICSLAPPFFYRGFTGEFGDRRVTVLLTGVGPSRVGDCVSFLALTPARRLLFAGAVGSLRSGHAIGDFFLPTEAADGEGYTRYLQSGFAEIAAAAPIVSCQTELSRAAELFLGKLPHPVRKGRVYTIGSIAFESRENLLVLERLGFDAIEMELSAFFSGAAGGGFDAAALTYVSDLPVTSSLWQPKGPREREGLRRAYRDLPRLCLEFLAAG
jgi:purine-nucleoside phosphorylase